MRSWTPEATNGHCHRHRLVTSESDAGGEGRLDLGGTPVLPERRRDLKTPALVGTHGQVAALTKFGIAADQVPNKGYASRLLDRIFVRRRNNLASPKQVATLHRFGVPGAQSLTFDEAKAAIDTIAANGWRAVA